MADSRRREDAALRQLKLRLSQRLHSSRAELSYQLPCSQRTLPATVDRPGLAVAGDHREAMATERGPAHEAEVGAPVEHVQVDGRAGFDDGRHRVQDLCREGRFMAEWSRAEPLGGPSPLWPVASLNSAAVRGQRPRVQSSAFSGFQFPDESAWGQAAAGPRPHPLPRGLHLVLTWRT